MELMIVPSEEPTWSISRSYLEQAVRDRWTEAGSYDTAADSPMVVTVEVAYLQGNLQINLDRKGTLLSLDAPDVASAADFAAWWAGQAPGLDPDLRVQVTADHQRSVSLHEGITADEVGAGLAA